VVGQRQLALRVRPSRLPVEPVLEDRPDRAVGAGADIEAAAARRTSMANPANPTELAAAAASHLRRRQNQPNIVKALFGKPEVRYAAG